MRTKIDADVLLCQVLIWLLLATYVALSYVVVLAVGTLPFSDPGVDFSPPWWLNMIAVVLIAISFLPVYRWVRAGVREFVYGQHENRYPALTQLSQRLESTPSPQTILPTIAETIAHTLKLPYVEIEAKSPGEARDDAAITVFGKPPKEAAIERVPLVYQAVMIGELRVAGRRRGELLSRSDLAVLHDLAQQVGIALYAAQLTNDLQAARERLVIAREEERRRIRNDLHDGLAPTLSALQLQLGTLRSLMRHEPEQAENLVNELGGDLRNATAEIRQLVYDLRPPMLDELGLVAAIRNLKFQGSEICFEVEAPEPMPKLPAAVEVAVYRIASEALHNVVKHARARNCCVSIQIEQDNLLLSVSDDGDSLPEGEELRAGVGIVSMRERAAELGGMLSVAPLETGGTRVYARIPIGAEARGQG
jgi:two-component system, NarL family, sensor kinase